MSGTVNVGKCIGISVEGCPCGPASGSASLAAASECASCVSPFVFDSDTGNSTTERGPGRMRHPKPLYLHDRPCIMQGSRAWRHQNLRSRISLPHFASQPQTIASLLQNHQKNISHVYRPSDLPQHSRSGGPPRLRWSWSNTVDMSSICRGGTRR